MELKYEIYIGNTPEKVWEILTTPKGTKATFFGTVLRSTFEEGSDYEYVGPGNDGDETVHVYGKVLKFEPHKVLSFEEHPGPSYYSNHADLKSRFTFTLEAVGETTKLTLVNDQWSDNHPGFNKAADTWNIVMSNIKTFAETGKTLNFGW